MKTIIATLSLLLIAFTSCKKQGQPQPQIIEKIVNHYDTIYQGGDTVIINTTDTVYINTSPTPLIGVWKCWKMESFTGGSLMSTDYNSNWEFTFGTSILTQDLGTSGTYSYPINYYTGYVGVNYTSTPTNYFVENVNNGSEYILTKESSSGNYQVWYLRK